MNRGYDFDFYGQTIFKDNGHVHVKLSVYNHKKFTICDKGEIKKINVHIHVPHVEFVWWRFSTISNQVKL